MQRSLFLSIIERICAQDNYFVQKRDAIGYLGLSPHQKITATLCMLCCNMYVDAMIEYCRTSESTAIMSLKRFSVVILEEVESYYLRQPT